MSKELFDDPEFWVALGKDDEMLRSMGAYDDEPEKRIAELEAWKVEALSLLFWEGLMEPSIEWDQRRHALEEK